MEAITPMAKKLTKKQIDHLQQRLLRERERALSRTTLVATAYSHARRWRSCGGRSTSRTNASWAASAATSGSPVNRTR
jgi:hypothetical protein